MKKFNLSLGVIAFSLSALTLRGSGAIASGAITVQSSDSTIFDVTTKADGIFELHLKSAGHAEVLVDYAGDDSSPGFDQSISVYVVDDANTIDHFELTVIEHDLAEGAQDAAAKEVPESDPVAYEASTETATA